MENALLDVEPSPDNYAKFVHAVKKTACAHIPRRCWEKHITGLTEESSQLLEQYEKEFEKDPFSDSTHELGEALIDLLGKERQRTWQELTENTNMSQNSKIAWSTLRKLNGDKNTPPTIPDVTLNQVGS